MQYIDMIRGCAVTCVQKPLSSAEIHMTSAFTRLRHNRLHENLVPCLRVPESVLASCVCGCAPFCFPRDMDAKLKFAWPRTKHCELEDSYALQTLSRSLICFSIVVDYYLPSITYSLACNELIVCATRCVCSLHRSCRTPHRSGVFFNFKTPEIAL